MYAGMIVLQSTQPWPGKVPIEPVNQPEKSVLLNPELLGQVGNIRYIAPPDVKLTASNFRATVDLRDAKVSESESSFVKVRLVADDSRVQIIDYQPQQISVRLDPLVTRSVSVRAKLGTPPSGLEPGTPVLSFTKVDVTGAASDVRRVSYAEARVGIDASGLDINKDVDLVAHDAADAVVNNVEFNPLSVNVQVQVGSQLRTETVAVHPVTQGNPAAGYYISSIDIDPPLVSVRGEADALARLNDLADTKPISIAGRTGDVSVSVALNLPSGVEAVDTTAISVVVHLQSPSSTRSVTVGIVPDGARPDRVYTLSILNVIVTLGGADAALNAFDTSTLVATVSVGDLDVGTYTVKLTMTLPPGIKALPMSPSEITVVVDKPASPGPSASAVPSPSPT
jgi:YbbR domain-containing protein